MTSAEKRVQESLARLAEDYQAAKSDLDKALTEARELADPIRYQLLHSAGHALTDAVGAVLRQEGLNVTDLDQVIGSKPTDFLIRHAPQTVLVEVKSASGAATETLITDLQRHLATWSQLHPGTPLDGDILVINAQTKLILSGCLTPTNGTSSSPRCPTWSSARCRCFTGGWPKTGIRSSRRCRQIPASVDDAHRCVGRPRPLPPECLAVFGVARLIPAW
ncbi:hypothetical protein [Streptosporangium amethystogenes]|uniref:hypothetical protein n=1 Tax=Streptosporangium amethystogenes TaxID=2002 RepID=UPI0012FBFDFE|nr:hypothetical protein [Streptosporangium amethystogenes]